jgi:hypothetical protein
MQPVPEKLLTRLVPEMLATDIAEYLVRKGLPFRETHHIAGINYSPVCFINGFESEIYIQYQTGYLVCSAEVRYHIYIHIHTFVHTVNTYIHTYTYIHIHIAERNYFLSYQTATIIVFVLYF